MRPKEIFEKVRKQKRKNLSEVEAREVLTYYKIPVVKGEIIKSIEDAIRFSEKNGYPVVLKVLSPNIIHKTDVGGIILDIKNEKELTQAYSKMLREIRENAPKAEIEGFFIQEMIQDGYEVIVGGKQDQTFGSVVLFGLGGIFVEVFDDVSFRVVPISREDALDMIKEIKGFKILQGYRGKRPADLNVLIDVLMKTSKMLEENPEIKELDINPIFALPDKAIAVDARIII